MNALLTYSDSKGELVKTDKGILLYPMKAEDGREGIKVLVANITGEETLQAIAGLAVSVAKDSGNPKMAAAMILTVLEGVLKEAVK